MKKFLLVAALVGILVMVSATVAMAAPMTQGRGPGAGIHTPGIGWTDGNMPGRGMMRQQAGGQQGQCAGDCGNAQRGMPAWAGQPDAVEKLLDMTDDEIHVQRLAGKSLAQIAEAKGVGKDQLVKAILDAKKAILDEQVKAEKLTQAQADAIYAHMQQQVPVMVDRTGVGPARGQMGQQGNQTGRMGGRMGGRWSK
jgi:hypothetical protein